MRSRTRQDLVDFTVVATVLFHNFWTVADPVERQQQLTTFLEHIAILGGFTVLIFLGAGRLSLSPSSKSDSGRVGSLTASRCYCVRSRSFPRLVWSL